MEKLYHKECEAWPRPRDGNPPFETKHCGHRLHGPEFVISGDGSKRLDVGKYTFCTMTVGFEESPNRYRMDGS